eukprot:1159075-Pelagomonas_calceolata.AAC.8
MMHNGSSAAHMHLRDQMHALQALQSTASSAVMQVRGQAHAVYLRGQAQAPCTHARHSSDCSDTAP